MTDGFNAAERLALRAMVRTFAEQDVLPELDSWERAGELPRELHRKAGDLGLLGVGFPESVGGGGDLIDVIAVGEELHYAGCSGIGGGTSEIMTGLAAKRLGYTA